MSSLTSSEQWVRVPRPLLQPKIRLLCFSHGGGDASLFLRWPAALPPDLQESIEICAIELPGRAHRLRERPLYTNMTTLLETLVPQQLVLSPLYRYLDKPFAVVGVSLGGIIGFELVRRLASVHQLAAAALCVAVARAPHLPDPFHLNQERKLSEEMLFDYLRAYAGTPEYVLTNQSLMKLLLPKLRADTLLSTTYDYRPGAPLPCPITALGGISDQLVALADLAAWQQHTAMTFRFRLFPGEHFFLRDTTETIRKCVLDYLVQALRPTLQSAMSGALVPLEAV